MIHNGPTIKSSLGANASALAAEIDLQIYRLYDLSYDEVLLVDPAFAMTREEYEAAAPVPRGVRSSRECLT
ncbi:hypothetical protein [Pontibacter amylolyticus]|uniref:Uncharacterized protein n=1 Tax=Pontibacter amylolyticus TaxID=1424080 RepID=A0ABQ1W792_9BACT|nr:hypothetical protein [Pontibacter amylolyticus]GGG16179.1 hypothetical protein GCM10011323_20650 [Pontibacter amylolyticus]